MMNLKKENFKKWKFKKVFKNSFFSKTNMRETWILKQLQIM